MTLNMGPQHPATHGVLRLLLTVDGERVTGVDTHIGYLYRAIEKLCENKTYRQIIPLFDRLDYVSYFNNELPLVMALEKLMGIEVPERAEYIRVILCELNRIASHLIFYGSFAGDVGMITPFLYGFRDWERILMLFEAVSGSRMMPNYFRVGGVKQDLPTDFEERMGVLIPQLRQGIEECDDLVTHNEILLGRTRGVGVIGAAGAIDFGLSGPNLRASGVSRDLRRSQPYSVYERFQFDIPTGKQGDSWDRYWVRMEEMRQSLRIVEQALAGLPQGPVMAQVPRALRPPQGEVYVTTENPRGELGVYLVSRGQDKPYRLKIRAPSFSNLMALGELMRGSYVADCVAIIGSLDIVLGEVDR